MHEVKCKGGIPHYDPNIRLEATASFNPISTRYHVRFREVDRCDLGRIGGAVGLVSGSFFDHHSDNVGHDRFGQ